MIKTKKASKLSEVYVFALVVIVIISIIGAYIIIQKQNLHQAPDFTLTDTNGNTFNLSDFRGKVVVLDLMATWCGSCQQVEKELFKIYNFYQKEIPKINNSKPTKWFNNSGSLLGSDGGNELIKGITYKDFPFDVEKNATKLIIELKGEGNPWQDLDLELFDSRENSIATSENSSDHEKIVLMYETLKNLSTGEFKARVKNWGGGPNNFDITIGVYYRGTKNNTFSHNNSDVIIISIDVDPDESEETLKEYKENHSIPWIMAKDTDNVIKKYSAYEIAKIIIIDKEGNVIFNKVGVIKASEMKNSIDKALEGEAKSISIVSVSIIGLAFLAGIFSFFSPCSFPLLPGYMSYYLLKDQSKNGKLSSNTVKRALIPGISSALGILFVYLIIGIVVVIFSSAIKTHIPKLGPIVGIIFLILGFLMLTNIQYNFIINPIRNLFNNIIGKIAKLKKSKNLADKINKKDIPSFFAYGIGYGSAAAGCTAPIFIAIIFSAMEFGEDIGVGKEIGAFLIFLVYYYQRYTLEY